MSGKSIAVLLSFFMTIGSLDAAWSAPASAPPPAGSVRNAQSPLPPAGPATIKQAQGTDWSGPLLGAVVTGGIFLAVLLLINDDADGPATSTTTATLP
jgi:hypothetical protein